MSLTHNANNCDADSTLTMLPGLATRPPARRRWGASSPRLLGAFIVVLSLLFSQLALANYVCPQQQDAAAMAEMMASDMPCDGMDPEQPALCAQYSAGAPQSADTVKIPAMGAPLVVQVVELPFERDARAAHAVPLGATPQERPPPDQLFLSTLRLRV